MNTKTISISIFKIVLPLFVLLLVQFAANAQQFDLNGTWTIYDANGNKTPNTAKISHGQLNKDFGPGIPGISVFIVDGEGKKFSGGYQRNTIAKGSETDSSKPLSERLSRLSGDVSQEGTVIRWSDNTVWKKSV